MAYNKLYEMIDNFPEYLREFPEIKSLGYACKMVMSYWNMEYSQMLRRLALNLVADEGWKMMLDAENAASSQDALEEAHRIYEVVTLDEIRKMIGMWIKKDAFSLDFDNETKTFLLKTTLVKLQFEPKLRRIRNVLPCNCLLNLEYVSNI